MFAVLVSSSLNNAEFCACSEVWSANSEMLLPQVFALITRSSHTTDHCGSNISALADQTSEQAQNSALLSEELTKTANTQYSLVERFNR